MKNLTLVIHENLKADTADLLRNIEAVKRFTFTHVEDHGRQSDQDIFLSARDKVVGYIPRVRVDILLQDSELPQILKVLREADIGLNKHTIFWVVSVEQEGQF